MESWKKSFAHIADVCGVPALQVLRTAVSENYCSLIQGTTVAYEPATNPGDRTVCGACAVGYMYWKADDMDFADDVEEAVAATFSEVAKKAGWDRAPDLFTNWYDETPRDEMRRELLPVIDANIRRLEAA